MDNGLIDERIGFMLVMIETYSIQDPATLEFLQDYQADNGFEFTTVIDPTFELNDYFPAGGVPLQMVIDLDNMTLAFAGASSAPDVLEFAASVLD